VDILQKAGMANRTAEIHQRAFNNSHTVVFVFDEDKLIGFGRAISDGEYQAAIYDVAVSQIIKGRGLAKQSFVLLLETYQTAIAFYMLLLVKKRSMKRKVSGR